MKKHLKIHSPILKIQLTHTAVHRRTHFEGTAMCLSQGTGHTATPTHTHIYRAWPPMAALWLPPPSTATVTPSPHTSCTLQCFTLLSQLPHIHPTMVPILLCPASTCFPPLLAPPFVFFTPYSFLNFLSYTLAYKMHQLVCRLKCLVT